MTRFFSVFVTLFTLCGLTLQLPLSDAVLGQDSPVQVFAKIRGIYGFYERSNICLGDDGKPNPSGLILFHDTEYNNVKKQISCSVPADGSGSVNHLDINILQSEFGLNYERQVDGGRIVVDVLASYQNNDGTRLDHALGEARDFPWGSVSFGYNLLMFAPIIETGFLSGGLGHIADNAYRPDRRFSASRAYRASYAPTELVPASLSGPQSSPGLGFVYLSPSLSKWKITSGLAIGEMVDGPYFPYQPITTALGALFEDSFNNDQTHVRASLIVSFQAKISGLSDASYQGDTRLLPGGSALAGVRVDHSDFHFGTALSYAFKSTDVFTGKPCTIIPWEKVTKVCRDRYAFQISGGYDYQNLAVSGGLLAGFMPKALNGDLIDSLVNNREIDGKKYGLDSFVKLGFGGTLSIFEGVDVFVDTILSFDNVAVSEDQKTGDSQFFAIRGGYTLHF